MAENMLEGNIPPRIGQWQKLQYLGLRQNNLRGTISEEIFNLSSLTNLLSLSQNLLSGSIREEVGNLKNLNWLDMSKNHLPGDISGTIEECIKFGVPLFARKFFTRNHTILFGITQKSLTFRPVTKLLVWINS